ncbi:MAG TPA: PIN domain-containing protein [Sphingomonas sp.]
MPAFFDSNILLYLAQDDSAKADTVERLLRIGGWINVQVLNEVTHVARRKFGYDWDGVSFLLDRARALLQVADLTVETHDDGRKLAERYKLSVYDGMIVAAARSSGCDVLWSEDMHHGLVIDGVLTIRNPFAE